MGEILLHHMIDGISHSRCRMFGVDRKRISRIKERTCREQMWIDVSNLIIGFRTRNDTSGIIFTARSSQSQDINNRKGSQSRSLTGNQVPGFTIILGSTGNGFRTVKYRTSPNGKNDIDLLFLTNPHSLYNTGRIFRIRFNPAQFKNLKVFQ